MLRESSVPYSSLPQEDGGQSYVTTRTAAETHARNNRSRILSVIGALVLICGVPLLIIAPLALTRENGRVGTSVTEVVNWGIANPESNESGDEGSSGNDNSESNSDKGFPSSLVEVTNAPPKIATVTLPGLSGVVTKPRPTTTTTTTSTTTTTTTTAPPTTTTTTTPKPPTDPPIVVEPTDTILVPTVEVPPGKGTGKNQSGVAPQTTVVPQPKEEAGSGSDDGDEMDLTPTQKISSMVNNFLSEHEWWTLVGLAVAAALVISAVIATVAWIIQRRISSSRRRTNLQRVITDLQSRDKVVLLNSEESEDEA